MSPCYKLLYTVLHINTMQKNRQLIIHSVIDLEEIPESRSNAQLSLN